MEPGTKRDAVHPPSLRCNPTGLLLSVACGGATGAVGVRPDGGVPSISQRLPDLEGPGQGKIPSRKSDGTDGFG